MRRFALIFTVCSFFAPSVATADITARPSMLHLAGSHIGYPEDMYSFFYTEALARTLSRACSSLSISESRMSREFDKTIEKMLQKRVSIGKVKHYVRTIPEDRLRADLEAYAQKHNLSENSSEQDFCASGLAEIDEGTRVGRLLKRN